MNLFYLYNVKQVTPVLLAFFWGPGHANSSIAAIIVAHANSGNLPQIGPYEEELANAFQLTQEYRGGTLYHGNYIPGLDGDSHLVDIMDNIVEGTWSNLQATQTVAELLPLAFPII